MNDSTEVIIIREADWTLRMHCRRPARWYVEVNANDPTAALTRLLAQLREDKTPTRPDVAVTLQNSLTVNPAGRRFITLEGDLALMLPAVAALVGEEP